MSWRTFVGVISALLFCAVLFIGLRGISGDADIDAPQTITTVEKGAAAATPTVTNKTTVIGRAPGQEPTRTTTTQVQGGRPERPRATVTTTTDGERTTLERILGDGGVSILQIALVVLAAFLAAAVAQRVLVAQYGGFKIGGVELGSIADASTTGIVELKDAVKQLRQDAAMDVDVRKALEESRHEDAAVNRDLALLLRRLDLIERRLDQLSP
jgi:hypothetical protein